MTAPGVLAVVVDGDAVRGRQQPVRLKTHDFPGQAQKANPYGISYTTAHSGWVSIGTDQDTTAFAVASIRHWVRTAVSCRSGIRHHNGALQNRNRRVVLLQAPRRSAS